MPSEEISTSDATNEEASSVGRAWLRDTLLLPLLIANIAVLAYGNSLGGDFVFDDEHDIVENERIRDPWTAWKPTGGVWRPVVWVSFAVNHAISRTPVWFHAVNLVIHLLAALTLYGIVRRTLLLDSLRSRFEKSATWLALAVSLLWMAHPLQTEAVTYIVHRYESLMGLFYLLTIYCFLRGATATQYSIAWYVAAVISSAFGMGCKEVMVTAPLIILLYDRIFLCQSWREVFARRWPVYLGLAATWSMLAMQIMSAIQPKQPWAGFGIRNRSPLEYAQSQPGVILHYLRLCFWPTGQCLDYGWPVARTAEQIVPPALAIAALLLATAVAMWRRPALGFLGLWFFLILAPTSSIMPIADIAAERRMYLSLAAVIVLVVFTGNAILKWLARALSLSPFAHGYLASLLVFAPLLLLCLLTIFRNQDYLTNEGIWRDVIEKRPENSRGYHNLAAALSRRGQPDEVTMYLEEAVKRPNASPNTYRDLGRRYASQGRLQDAWQLFQAALAEAPDDADTHNQLGMIYMRQGKLDASYNHLTACLEIKPTHAEAHNNLGVLLFKQGKTAEAREHYAEAIRLNPEFADPYDNIGVAFMQEGRDQEARESFAKAVELNPRSATALNHLGMILVKQNEVQQAVGYFQQAVAINGREVTFRCNLGDALLKLGKTEAAREQYRQSRQISPGWPESINKMAWQLATDPDAKRRDGVRALKNAEQVCRATEEKEAAHLDTLAAAYAETGDFKNAIGTAQKAMQVALAASQKELAAKIEQRMHLYRIGQPYRDHAKK